MPERPTHDHIGLIRGAAGSSETFSKNREHEMSDYSFGYEYRARLSELQDIAAMDRLAAELAPASRLRRHADARGYGRASAWTERIGRVFHVARHRRDRHPIARGSAC
jgi:hypothetical protein